MLDAVDERRIADLLGEMTLDEKLLLIGGADAWRTHGIPRLGIQPIKVTDGPHGARGGTFGEVPSASFPCGTAFGATWDRDLMREVGVAIAEEAKQKQAQIFEAQLVEEGKPEKARPKIIEGKIAKWLKEVCLLEQASVLEAEKTVDQLRAELEKELGTQVTLSRFVRFERGEGIEKPTGEDFAAEVAKMAGG